MVGLTGSTSVTLNGAITTDNTGSGETLQTGDVTITGPAKLNAAITIDTSAGDGFVKFTSTLDGADATDRNLTIESGTGKVTFDGVIGGIDDRNVGVIDVNSDSADGSGEIEITDIGDGGSIGSGAITLGNTTTDKITFDGQLYKTGNALFTAKTGETILMTDATNNATFTLSDKTLEFATGTIKLSNGVDLTAGTGNGAITIHSLEEQVMKISL